MASRSDNYDCHNFQTKRKVGCCGDVFFTTHKTFNECTLLKYAEIKPFIASHKIISKVFHQKSKDIKKNNNPGA